MKKLLFLLIHISLGLAVSAQVNSSHAYAHGYTSEVTIHWDAFAQNQEIIGCQVYKQKTQSHTPVLITPELLTSNDSTYSFVDSSKFDEFLPAIYTIYALTNSGTYLINECYSFALINFEAVHKDLVELSVRPWSREICCTAVTINLNGELYEETIFDEEFNMQFNLSDWAPGDLIELVFDADIYYPYQLLHLSYEFLYNTAMFVKVPELSEISNAIQISPNPFSKRTTINFELPEDAFVSLKVYTSGGKVVQQLIDESMPRGNHSIICDMSGLPPGVYLLVLGTNIGRHTKKLIVL